MLEKDDTMIMMMSTKLNIKLQVNELNDSRKDRTMTDGWTVNRTQRFYQQKCPFRAFCVRNSL